MAKGMGYIFGVVFGVPLIILIINLIFFRGNPVDQKEITSYIHNSKVIEVFIPTGTNYNSESYYPNLTLGNNIKSIYRIPFYSSDYHKNLALIIFKGFDFSDRFDNDKNTRRLHTIYSGGYFLVWANKKQWNDPAYGTKENPVPVFGIEVTGEVNGKTKTHPIWLAQAKESFDVPEDINRIFVEQYLAYFLSKQDFNILFDKK